MSDLQHPSFLRLDRWHLHGRPADGVACHVAQCGRCRGHTDALAMPLAHPAWLDAVATATRPPRRWRFPALVFSFLAAAAAVMVVATFPQEAPTPPIRSKGAPQLVVYVKRGERVGQWDGSSPVRRGDRVRLAVVAAGFSHVTVLGETVDPQGRRSLQTLFVGPLEVDVNDQQLLPAGWLVEGEADAEVLWVVLAEREVKADEMVQLDGVGVSRVAPIETDDYWAKRLRLPRAENAFDDGDQP